jgi:hypothetical protein
MTTAIGSIRIINITRLFTMAATMAIGTRIKPKPAFLSASEQTGGVLAGYCTEP